MILFVSMMCTNFIQNSKATTAQAAEQITNSINYRTTLKDRSTKAARLTFDVWVTDSEGNKIEPENIKVTNNGKKVGVNWNDIEKTSYTLLLDLGENQVVVEITNGDDILTKTYTIIQEEAQDGDIIGDFVFSMDAFTLGTGFLIEPQRTPIIKGENSAQILVQLLEEKGFTYESTGSLNSGFYLAAVNSDNINFYESLNIPEKLIDIIENDYGEIWYDDIDESRLGEFDLTYMSGWMYAINDVFPNVGFSDSYPQQDDVLRTQFTLYGYGRDIGSGGIWGEDFFQENNKDEATRALAYINSSKMRTEILESSDVQVTYDNVLEIIQLLDIDQASLNHATEALNYAVVKWALKNDQEEKYQPDLTEEQKLLLDDVLGIKQRIAALPTVDQVLVTDAATIDQLKEEIASLNPKQIDLIPNVSKLEELQNKINEKMIEIEKVNKLIEQLPTADRLSFDDQDLIENIRNAYDALSDDQKSKVENYGLFKNIESTYEKFAINTLTKQIEELPTVKQVTLDNGEDIKQILQNYNNLSEKIKKQIKNSTKLQEVNERYQSLVEIHQVQLKINKLPTPENLTMKHEQQVKEAREEYETLTEKQQQEIDINLLEKLEIKMEQLIISSKKISNVINLINNLPSVEVVKLSDRTVIELARSLYDALSATDKEKVTNESNLIRIEAVLKKLENEKLEDEKPLRNVENLINSIPSPTNITLQSQSIIQQASTAYDQLTIEQQKQVSNYYVLVVAQAIYDDIKSKDDAQKAQVVTEKIASLPSVSLIDLTDETAIKIAKNSYDQLTDIQKKLVLYYESIQELEKQIENLKVEALKVKNLITALPAVSKITETDRSKIEDARIAYTALTTAQKKLVTNSVVLDQAELQLAQLQEEAVKKIIATIAALPESISQQDEKTIREVRGKYDQLKLKQQSLVTNYEKLKSAEKALEKLIDSDKDKAKKVEQKIADLSKTITAKNKATVESVRKAYDALTYSQSLYVSNLSILQSAEKVLADIKEADQKKAKKVADMIEQLPTTTKIDLDDQTIVTTVRKAYNGLTSEQKQYVKNYPTLQKLEAKLVSLEKDNSPVEIDIPTIKNTTKTIEGYVTPGSKLVVYKGSKKLKTAKVDEEGFYKVTLPLQKKNTKLKFIVYSNKGEKLLQKSITVKGASVTAASSIKASGTKVVGTAPKSKIIKIYNGSNLIGKTKSTKTGKFTVKIKKQKKGTKLKVIVLDSVGNKSKAKTVKVK